MSRNRHPLLLEEGTMSCLRKLLLFSVLLAFFDRNAALSPLFAQESTPRSPSPSSSPGDKPLSADAEAWRKLAARYEAEALRLRDERDHASVAALRCQINLQQAEEHLSETNAKSLNAVENPEVQVSGNDVLVTARPKNLAHQPSRGTAFILLLLDNKIVATAKEIVSITPKAELSVTHRFEGVAGKGKFSASVSFNP